MQSEDPTDLPELACVGSHSWTPQTPLSAVEELRTEWAGSGPCRREKGKEEETLVTSAENTERPPSGD